VDFVAAQTDISQFLCFLQVNADELTILFLLLLVDQIDHSHILDQTSGGGNQEVLHRNARVHEGQRDRIKRGRSVATVILQYKNLQVNLGPRVLLKHDDLLED